MYEDSLFGRVMTKFQSNSMASGSAGHPGNSMLEGQSGFRAGWRLPIFLVMLVLALFVAFWIIGVAIDRLDACRGESPSELNSGRAP